VNEAGVFRQFRRVFRQFRMAFRHKMVCPAVPDAKRHKMVSRQFRMQNLRFKNLRLLAVRGRYF
jgi:hypothetical protein